MGTRSLAALAAVLFLLSVGVAVADTEPITNATLYPTAPSASIPTGAKPLAAIAAWRDTSLFRDVYATLAAKNAVFNLSAADPAAVLVPTDAAFVRLALSLAPEGADGTNIALIAATVNRLVAALESDDAVQQLVNTTLAYHVVPKTDGDSGTTEAALQKLGSVQTLAGLTLNVSDLPRVTNATGAVSTKLGRSTIGATKKSGTVVMLIDRVLLPTTEVDALRSALFPADLVVPPKPTPAALSPNVTAPYQSYEDPGFRLGVPTLNTTDRALLAPAPFFYGLRDYVGFVASRADLHILRAIVLRTNALRNALPGLSSKHPVLPTDAAFGKFVKKFNNSAFDAALATFEKDPRNRSLADALLDLVVPAFDALPDAPSLEEVVLYHIMDGDKDLDARNGTQATLLQGQNLTVGIMKGHGDHGGHDHGGEDGHGGHNHDRVTATKVGGIREGDHTIVNDGDDSRGPAHIVATFPTAQGYVSVIDTVMLPFNLMTKLRDAGSDDKDDDDGVCFPADAQVHLADGSVKPMGALQAGDAVQTHPTHSARDAASAAPSRVFLFSHRDAERRVQLVRVETASGHVVRATASHYLYVGGSLRAFGAVKVGDVVHTVAGASAVVKVSRVVGKGLYAPHATHGDDLVVDGVRVSSYSTAVHPRWAEAALAPLRVLARLGVTEPLGRTLYNGADSLVGLLPKGQQAY